MPARRVRRTRKDWVYNVETYEQTPNTQLVGINNAACYRLFDSVQHTLQARGAIAAPVFQHGQERPDNRGIRYYGLDGLMHIAPTNWAIGTTMHLIVALIITEQAVVDGSCLLDANFNLGSLPTDSTPGIFANQYTTVKVWRFQRGFASANDQTIFTLPLRWFSRRGRRMREQDAAFLYVELPTVTAQGTAVNLRWQWWCRSLVERKV